MKVRRKSKGKAKFERRGFYPTWYKAELRIESMIREARHFNREARKGRKFKRKINRHIRFVVL